MNRFLIAALKQVVAKEWFDETPSVNLQSEALQYFFEDIYTANSDEKYMYTNIAKEMEEEGLDPHEKDYEEYNERASEAEEELSTNRVFKKPKVLKNVRVLHFTESDPEKLIKDIKNENFDGCDGSNMGVTQHMGCNWGTLGFGYLADKKIKKSKTGRISEYGNNAIEFTALEAVQVYHDSDFEEQIIWDSEFVKDLEVKKL